MSAAGLWRAPAAHAMQPVAPVLLGTGVLLGVGLPIAKALASHGVGALAFTVWPTAFAGLLLVLLAALRHPAPEAHWRTLRFSVIAGIAGHAVPMTLAFALSSRAGAGMAAMAFTLPPVFTLAMNLALGRERPRVLRVAAVGVGLAGAVALVLSSQSMSALSAFSVAGLIAVPALIGATNVYRAVHLPSGVAPEWLGGLTLLASALVLGMAGAVTGRIEVPWTAAVLLGLGLQTLAMTGGYLLYFELQRRAEPVTFSFMGYVVMLTGTAVGAVLFGERLSWSMLPALLLVLAALGLLRHDATSSQASGKGGLR